MQSEDYGARVALSLLRARGEMGRWFGRDSMDERLRDRAARARAPSRPIPSLDQATRDVYDGFAAGVNRYIELPPEEFPPGFAPHFTGYDVSRTTSSMATADQARRSSPR